MADAKVNQYEAMFLFGGSAAGDLEQAQNLCRQVLEKHGGQIQVLKKWDDRRMAYEIEGQKRGVYIISFFKAPGEAVVAIEREVSLTDQILRVMVLRADHLNEQEMAAVEPQPIAPKEERSYSDRPRHDDRAEGGESRKAPEPAEAEKE
jgi:small subunit ribosomal protein S6